MARGRVITEFCMVLDASEETALERLLRALLKRLGRTYDVRCRSIRATPGKKGS